MIKEKIINFKIGALSNNLAFKIKSDMITPSEIVSKIIFEETERTFSQFNKQHNLPINIIIIVKDYMYDLIAKQFIENKLYSKFNSYEKINKTIKTILKIIYKELNIISQFYQQNSNFNYDEFIKFKEEKLNKIKENILKNK